MTNSKRRTGCRRMPLNDGIWMNDVTNGYRLNNAATSQKFSFLKSFHLILAIRGVQNLNTHLYRRLKYMRRTLRVRLINWVIYYRLWKYFIPNSFRFMRSKEDRKLKYPIIYKIYIISYTYFLVALLSSCNCIILIYGI